MKKINLVRIDLDKRITTLVKNTDHRLLGIWANDCSKRVLHYFKEKYPKDNRPQKALETLKKWIKTGDFKMSEIRKASLDSHAAARSVKEDDTAARSAARSAGQAVATAHVPSHSIGAAIYAATAVRDATNSLKEVKKERDWQYKRLFALNKKTTHSKTLWRSKKK